MSVRATEMETLLSTWDSAEHVLRHWGHGSQARVVSACREALREEIGRDGPLRAGALLRVWGDDAAALATYGHGEDASSLKRCREDLRLALGLPESAVEDATRGRRMARPHWTDSVDGGEGTDEESASAGASPTGERTVPTSGPEPS